MSAEHNSDRFEETSRTIEYLIQILDDREVARKLHRLGDEVNIFALEAAAIRAKDEGATDAVRDLRKHLLADESPEDFLSTYPEHTGVDFEHLMKDAQEISRNFADASPGLLATTPIVAGILSVSTKETEQPSGEEMPAQKEIPSEEDEKILAIEPPRNARRILSGKYPKVKVLLDSRDEWIEDPNNLGIWVLSRKKIEELIIKKDPSRDISRTQRNTVMSSLVKQKWESIYDRELGIKIAGLGVSKYLTEEDAVNLLWLLHARFGKRGFCPSFQLDTSIPVAGSEDKKKRAIPHGFNKR